MKLPFGMMTKLANTDLQKAAGKKKKKGLGALMDKAKAKRDERRAARGGEASNFSKFIHNMGVAYQGGDDPQYKKFNRKAGDKAAAEKGTANEIKNNITPKQDPVEQASNAGGGFAVGGPTPDRIGTTMNSYDMWKQKKYGITQ